MPTFGMLALGVFMGSIIAFGIRGTTDWNDLKKTLSVVVSVAFSGGLFAFFTMVERLGGNLPGDSLFMYPVGLAPCSWARDYHACNSWAPILTVFPRSASKIGAAQERYAQECVRLSGSERYAKQKLIPGNWPIERFN